MDSQNAMMYMPVAPAAPGYGSYGGNGNGMFGGDLWGFIILLALLGGFGNFGGNRGGGGFPFPVSMPSQQNTDNVVQRGFDQQAIMAGIGAVQNGINGLGNSLCNSFAQAEAAANGRYNGLQQQGNATQMAMMQGFMGVQNQFCQCCGDQKAGFEAVKYAVADQGCQDRSALNDAFNALSNKIDTKVQGIHDKLCQLELDNVKQNYENRIAGMQNALDAERSANQSLRFAASQGNQTAAIQAGQRALANEIEQYVNPTPRPAWIVQNPSCCQNQMPCCNGWMN